ncbi:MAG: FHA domain-containing protein [Limisphaerales bacterium]
MTINCIHQGQRKTYTFDHDEVIVGRSSSKGNPDLRLDHDLHVSRRHARLCRKGELVFVEDLESRGGVFVNHAKIKAPWELHPGDAVKIGDTLLTLEVEATLVDDKGEFKGTLEASVPPRIRSKKSKDGSTMNLKKEDFANGSFNDKAEVRIENQFDAWNRSYFIPEKVTEESSRRLKDLYDLPLQFAVEEEPSDLRKLVLLRAVEMIPGARRGALLSYDGLKGKLSMRRCYPEGDEPTISRTLLKQSASQGATLVWSWRETVDGELQTGVYAPLIWNENVRGMLYLDGLGREKPFSEEEARMTQAIAHYAAMAFGVKKW